MSDDLFAVVHARPKRRQGITGQTIDAQMRGTMCQITEWELEELSDELARLRAEVERLTAALADERRHADALSEAAEMLDTHAVAIHDADGKCYSVRARDYARLFDAISAHRGRRQG